MILRRPMKCAMLRILIGNPSSSLFQTDAKVETARLICNRGGLVAIAEDVPNANGLENEWTGSRLTEEKTEKYHRA